MNFITFWHILPIALALDLIIGDPEHLFHPVRWMGKAILHAEPFFRKIISNAFISGFIFASLLILATWTLAYAFLAILNIATPMAKHIGSIVLCYYCLSAGSLKKAGMDIYTLLKQKKVDAARNKVAFIVGRDTSALSESGIARATVETVAENLVDGVISPLFYAAIGGAPLAMAYKMVNTLDSMIGYKNNRYKDFGKAAARIDDAANFIPARLSVFIISFAAYLLCNKGYSAFKTAVNEGSNHLSPNSGYPEAAFAGALGVKLGGSNIYHGQIVNKPYIGNMFGCDHTIHIKQACDLMICSSLLGLAFALVIDILLYYAPAAFNII
jgi:adenosylcobinamide-phosphate synthase